MKEQVHKAYKMLLHFSDYDRDDTAIPPEILEGAKGLVFMSHIKAGVVWSGSVGTGCVIANLGNGKWSGPIEVCSAGAGFGMQWGAQKSDSIIVLNTAAALKAFSGGQVKLGTDLSMALGPVGRQITMDAHVGKSVAACFSYSYSSGLFMGVSLEGAILTVKPGGTKKYYGEKHKASAVLKGNIDIPANANSDIKKIHALLNKMIAQGKTQGERVQRDQMIQVCNCKMCRGQAKYPAYIVQSHLAKHGVYNPATPAPIAKVISPPMAVPVNHPNNLTAVPVNKPQPWTCARCTFINKGSNDICALCETPKGAKVDSDGHYDQEEKEDKSSGGDILDLETLMNAVPVFVDPATREVEEWMSAVDPTLKTLYADQFIRHFTSMEAIKSTNNEQFAQVLKEMKVKKPHQNLFKTAHDKLSRVNDSAAIIEWLRDAGPNMVESYGKTFVERFQSLDTLLALSTDDFKAAMGEMKVKKPHQSLLVKHRASNGGGGDSSSQTQKSKMLVTANSDIFADLPKAASSHPTLGGFGGGVEIAQQQAQQPQAPQQQAPQLDNMQPATKPNLGVASGDTVTQQDEGEFMNILKAASHVPK